MIIFSKYIQKMFRHRYCVVPISGVEGGLTAAGLVKRYGHVATLALENLPCTFRNFRRKHVYETRNEKRYIHTENLRMGLWISLEARQTVGTVFIFQIRIVRRLPDFHKMTCFLCFLAHQAMVSRGLP